MKFLTHRERPDKMNSLRSKVMMINKENLTQDRVKTLWLQNHTCYFSEALFTALLYSWITIWREDGSSLKKEAFITSS